MKKYPLVDVIRLICACLVTMIHMGTSPDTTPIAHLIKSCFAIQAVPFFFITSGFFFAKKLFIAENKSAFIKMYSKRMLLFYGIWVVLQMPIILMDYWPLYKNRSIFVFAAVILRRVFLAGTSPFWYLLALAETSLLAGVLIIHKKEKILYFLASIGFLLSYIYGAGISYSFVGVLNRIIYLVFSWGNNFLMAGIPYFSVGIFCACAYEKWKPNSTILLILYGFISVINLFCYRINPEILGMAFLHAPQAILLFLIGLSVDRLPINVNISEVCRKLSSAIYCLHIFVIYYFLGTIIPWSGYYIIDLCSVLITCVFCFEITKHLKSKSLYRLLILQ